jgi:hypothetical protein
MFFGGYQKFNWARKPFEPPAHSELHWLVNGHPQYGSLSTGETDLGASLASSAATQQMGKPFERFEYTGSTDYVNGYRSKKTKEPATPLQNLLWAYTLCAHLLLFLKTNFHILAYMLTLLAKPFSNDKDLPMNNIPCSYVGMDTSLLHTTKCNGFSPKNTS